MKRLETSREVIFNSVRQGFAAAYDSLVIDPALQGRGWEVAKEVWPDSILASPPAHLIAAQQQADAKPVELVPKSNIEKILDTEVETKVIPRRKRDALVGALLRLQSMVTGQSQAKRE